MDDTTEKNQVTLAGQILSEFQVKKYSLCIQFKSW